MMTFTYPFEALPVGAYFMRPFDHHLYIKVSNIRLEGADLNSISIDGGKDIKGGVPFHLNDNESVIWIRTRQFKDDGEEYDG